MRTIDDFRLMRRLAMYLRRRWMQARYGANLHPTAIVSLSANFVSSKRNSISVGSGSRITFKVLLCADDPISKSVLPISIGHNCFIGGGSFVGPGVTIGDMCIVAAGSIVLESFPANTVIAGNPAKIVRSAISVNSEGRFHDSKL